MAEFNIFGSATEDDIRVAYIDPKKGLVEGVTRCQANDYAKLNPGTQFIFRTTKKNGISAGRDEIRYLNINEVNDLVVSDLGNELGEKSCEEYAPEGTPELVPVDCGAAKAYFYGGGGIGVKGIPIIGLDGGLMAVAVTSGGYGYKYPPIVEVKDDCGIAAGAVTRAVLGETTSSTEIYDQEDDFEEPKICPPEETEAYGSLYNAKGKEVGDWNPKTYTNPEEPKDPIRKEILQYQERLRAIKTPFWSTRMNPPLRIIGPGKNDRTKYDVQHHAWGGRQKTKTKTSPPSTPEEFIDVKMKVFTQGGHGRGMLFNFASEDGTHKFTIKADNFPADSTQTITKKVKRNTVYKVVAEGAYRGVGVEQGLVNKLGRKPKEIKATGAGKAASGSTIFCDFVKSSNDNDDLQVQVTQGKFTARNRDKKDNHDTYELEYFLGDSSAFQAEPKSKTKTKTIIDDTFMNRHAISPIPPSNVPGSDFAGQMYIFEWEENFPLSGEYIFRAMSDNDSIVYLDNRKVMTTSRFKGAPDKLKKIVSEGVHKIRIDLFNVPQDIEKTIVTQPPLEINSADNSAGNEYEIVYIDLNSRNEKLKVSDDRKRIDFSDDDGKFNDSDLQILEGDAVFSKDGKKIIGEGGVKLKFSWYEDPAGGNGLAVGKIKIRSKTLGSNRDLSPGYKKGQDTDVINLGRVDRSTRLASVSGEGIKEKTVFTTAKFIDKADRPLWKTNHTAAPGGNFVDRFGISPFDILSDEASSDDYAGTHTIRWENLKFPIDGNYGIEVAVDDNVTLKFIDQTGNETIIEKKGFTGPTERGGKATGVSTVIQNFKAGKYRLVAELFQRSGKPLAGGNPMVLAIRIKTFFIKETEIVKRSWNQNPMGAALTITAPPVPRPELPIPKAPGRCPNNPFWTTRLPAKGVLGRGEYWYPVFVAKRWGKFMNRYAISPLPPLAKRSTDGGGITYTNTWDIDVPYDGYFGLRATVDNGGRILIDGQEVMRGGLGYGRGGIEHFKNNQPKIKKIFIGNGKHEITVELRNEDTEERQNYKQKIFDTNEWIVKPTKVEPSPCTLDISYTDLHPRNKKLKVSSDRKKIDFSDGDGKFNDGYLEITSGDAVFSKDGRHITGTGDSTIKFRYDDDPKTDGPAIGGVTIGTVNLPRPKKGLYVSAFEAYIRGNISMISDRSKTEIVGPGWKSNSDLLYAPDMYQGRVYGPEGRERLRNSDPNDFNRVLFPGDYIPTSRSNGTFAGYGESLTGFTGTKEEGQKGRWQSDADDPDQGFGFVSGGYWPDTDGEGTYEKSGTKTATINICGERDLTVKFKGGLNSGTTQDGVTYTGPKLASYKRGFLTPAYTDDAQYLDEFQGETWKLEWTGVNFPQDGNYIIKIEADDIATLRIDGQQVGRARVRQGLREFNTNLVAGKKTVEIELFNQGNIIGPFSTNPTFVSAKIVYKGSRGTGKSKSWDDNPMGISAELIPPPCPKEVGGKGIVERVIVDDPGNGFNPPDIGIPVIPPPPEEGVPPIVPIALKLISIEIDTPGINIDLDTDKLTVDDIEVPYEVDTFGRIKPPIPPTPASSTGGPPPPEPPVPPPGLPPFVRRPVIRLETETGIPPTFKPQFEIVVDPVDVPEELLIQVTDLPGIKLNGYVNGRAYYGSVYLDDGLKFAGLFASVGEPVRVYDTLQESIDAEVTTIPSAILRQGTDIRSNAPRLDIPDTPDEIV